MRLKEEIKQTKPFGSLEEEAFLNLQRTADAAMRAFEDLVKPFGLTHTQYNVLRILRGAGGRGLLCREIGERMITRDPDVTRLLDRLEIRGLAARSRDLKDRRIVRTCITEQGLELLGKLDRLVMDLHRQRLRHLPRAKLRSLIDLLEATRRRR